MSTTTIYQDVNWKMPDGTTLAGLFEDSVAATAIINKALRDSFAAGRESVKDHPVPVAAIRLHLAGGGFRDIGFTSVHDRDVLLAFISNSGVSPAAAQQIAIVSMPERETTTEVDRNSSGSITSTKQTERDAA